MYHVVTALISPLPLVFLLLGLAVLNLWRAPRYNISRSAGVTFWYLLAVVSCMPVAAHFALDNLESHHAPLELLPEDTEVIVILSGGAYRINHVRIREQLDASTIYRCLEGARLFRQNPTIPILLTGGKVSANEPGEAYAQVMREFLISIGIPDEQIIVEDLARSTYENAVYSAKILQERDIRRIVLVTEATHMMRAEMCFSMQDLNVTTASCRYRAARYQGRWQEFVPRPRAALALYDVAHEWTGFAYYRYQGRL